MENLNEYDNRQLRRMYESLIAFEKKQIQLSSLVSNLEFLLNLLESRDIDFKENCLEEISTLETINALEIIKDSGEEIIEIEKDKKAVMINKSIIKLKNEINKKIHFDV